MRLNDNGDLVLQDQGDAQLYIPARHVYMICARLLQGYSYQVASPVYFITREEAAFILNNAQEIME